MPGATHDFVAFVERAAGQERVVRALVGESPARFRGRILLERASHLMVATERTLHDIADDSGFVSQDAFARAFRRERGVLPSVWRAEPTSYLIDAPNEVHFRPPAGIDLPAQQRMDGGDLVVAMAEEHVRLVASLADRAGPEGGESDPRSLLNEMERFTAIVRGATDDAPHPDQELMPALRRRLDRVGREFVDAVAMLAATGRFDEAHLDCLSPTAPVQYAAMLAHVLTGAARSRVG